MTTLLLLWGNAHIAGFTSSDQAVYGPFQSRLATALFRAPTTWICHLANQRGALSHAQRAGSVYKAAVWSTWDNVLDASLSYCYNGISTTSKISAYRPGSDPAFRPLIHPRNIQPAASHPLLVDPSDPPDKLQKLYLSSDSSNLSRD
jgi:hypothetical protein